LLSKRRAPDHAPAWGDLQTRTLVAGTVIRSDGETWFDATREQGTYPLADRPIPAWMLRGTRRTWSSGLRPASPVT